MREHLALVRDWIAALCDMRLITSYPVAWLHIFLLPLVPLIIHIMRFREWLRELASDHTPWEERNMSAEYFLMILGAVIGVLGAIRNSTRVLLFGVVLILLGAIGATIASFL